MFGIFFLIVGVSTIAAGNTAGGLVIAAFGIWGLIATVQSILDR